MADLLADLLDKSGSSSDSAISGDLLSGELILRPPRTALNAESEHHIENLSDLRRRCVPREFN